MSWTHRPLTASEAASVTRVPLKQVHRIIDAGLLAGRVAVRGGSRVILGTGVVGLKLAYVTADILTLKARRRIVRSVMRKPAVRAVRESTVTVDVQPIASAVRAGLGALARARKLVASDKDVLGGTPCFKGTRVPVHDIAAMIAGGDTRDRVLASYPQLDAEMIDAAVLYADAYPLRGRPRRRPPWRRRAPSASKTLTLDGLPPAT